MKCKDCEAAVKDFFHCAPGKYVCIGVKEPFVIGDINVECTQYPEYRKKTVRDEVRRLELDGEIYEPYVGHDGIYIPVITGHSTYYQRIISREMFVEAYNKWIKYRTNFYSEDDADDWCD